MENLEIFLANEKIAYEANVKLGNITYGKVGGYCKYIVYPDCPEKIEKLLFFAKRYNIEYTIVGETSNMLFLDDVRYGVILSTKLISQIEFNDCNSEVIVGAGVNLGFFLRKIYSLKMDGFEGLEGIPGSVGGAIFMNAGAYGYDISKNVVSVECIDTDGNFSQYGFDDCRFKQRSSIFREKRNLIITSAKFRLVKSEDNNYYKKIENYHTARHCYQEFVYPNMGSIFTAKKCIYEELSNVDKKYKIIKAIINRIFYNRIAKAYCGRNQNKRIVNLLTIKYFGLDKYSNVISEKHINMFANRGCSSWDFIDYIFKMKSILGNKVSLENEIVITNILEDNSSKLDKYRADIGKAKKYEWE